MTKQNLSQNDRLSLDKKNSLSSHLRWKTSLFLLSTAALLVPSLPLRAEMVKGIIENYSPQNQQATIRDRKSTRLNSSHNSPSRMPSSA